MDEEVLPLPNPVLLLWLLEAFGCIRLYTLLGTETGSWLSNFSPRILRFPVRSRARICASAALTGEDCRLLFSKRD